MFNIRTTETVISNALLRQTLIVCQQTVGENALHSILYKAGLVRFVGNLPPDNLNAGLLAAEYSSFIQTIETYFGKGGRCILRQIGKDSFLYGVKAKPVLLGIAGIALRVFPHKRRIKLIFSCIADVSKKTCPRSQVRVGEKSGKIYYIDSACVNCKGRQSEIPTCYQSVGYLAEAAHWVTGFPYWVRETNCRAMGDQFCRFEVAQRFE